MNFNIPDHIKSDKRKLEKILAFVLVSCLLVLASYGVFLKKRTDILSLTISEASSNDPEAQFRLGNWYETGIRVEQDAPTAFDWYFKSASQDFPPAQNKVGVFYELGIGVEPNEKKAYYWYEKSAMSGFVGGQYNIARMYDLGKAVDKDDKTAFEWYLKAAHQGDPRAQTALAYHYIKGLGVDLDKERAAFWYQKAAEQGHAEAEYGLAISYLRGDGVRKDFVKAGELLQKAAQNGSQSAINYQMSSRKYCIDDNDMDDPALAKMCYIAAMGGYAEAQYRLGVLYDSGSGVTQDKKQAAYWYERAAKQGHVTAQGFLAKAYYTGSGIPKNLVEAYAWSYLVISSRSSMDELESTAREAAQLIKQASFRDMSAHQKEQAEQKAEMYLVRYSQKH